jgi:hypothetical protein
MNNNPLFLFIQRFTRFDTGIKNMTSNISKSVKKGNLHEGKAGLLCMQHVAQCGARKFPGSGLPAHHLSQGEAK